MRRTKRTPMRVIWRPERRSMDQTRMWGKIKTSPMGRIMSIRTPSGATEVLKRKIGRSAEAMGTSTKSPLRREICRSRKRRNI